MQVPIACSGPPAHPNTRSGPAWSPPRVPARPTTTSVATRASGRPYDARAGGRMSITGREERVLQIIETARAKRARFRDEQITLAHGAGGKATQTLIEGLLVPAFTAGGIGSLAALADAGALEINGTGLAM